MRKPKFDLFFSSIRRQTSWDQVLKANESDGSLHRRLEVWTRNMKLLSRYIGKSGNSGELGKSKGGDNCSDDTLGTLSERKFLDGFFDEPKGFYKFFVDKTGIMRQFCVHSWPDADYPERNNVAFAMEAPEMPLKTRLGLSLDTASHTWTFLAVHLGTVTRDGQCEAQPPYVLHHIRDSLYFLRVIFEWKILDKSVFILINSKPSYNLIRCALGEKGENLVTRLVSERIHVIAVLPILSVWGCSCTDDKFPMARPLSLESGSGIFTVGDWVSVFSIWKVFIVSLAKGAPILFRLLAYPISSISTQIWAFGTLRDILWKLPLYQ